MRFRTAFFIPLLGVVMLFTALKAAKTKQEAPLSGHYMFVAVPGIRDYLGFGGHGLLVFDMDHGHQFVKRIETRGFHPNGKPSNVKGIAVSIQLNSIYVSTIESLERIDLTTGKLIWEKMMDGGCDRMSI